MEPRDHNDDLAEEAVGAPGTLGALLYAGPAGARIVEREWVELVNAVARGCQPSLHSLYDRAHRPVFTTALRITGNRETAEEVTLDVFHDVWRRAPGYDPGNGTVLGWIMNQARSRALDRLRFEHRRKRVDPGTGESPLAEEAPDPGELLSMRQEASAMRAAFGELAPEERQVLAAAFFGGQTHSEVAEKFREPLGTIKTRIRSGLRKLREAMGARTA